MENEIEQVVVVVRYNDEFHWFRSDRELWVLDRRKWAKDFADAGYQLPAENPSARFGIPVVDGTTLRRFLSEMSQHSIDKSLLGSELAQRFPNAQSWWDVGDLFPIMFVDGDKRHVQAFYPSGIPMERYVADRWTSEFDDFAEKATEVDLPARERYWIQNGVNMLKVLNERGTKLTGN